MTKQCGKENPPERGAFPNALRRLGRRCASTSTRWITSSIQYGYCFVNRLRKQVGEKYPKILDYLLTTTISLINWYQVQVQEYNGRKIHRRYVAQVKQVILSSPEIYLLRELYAELAEHRETLGTATSIPLTIYYKMLGSQGSIRKNWLQLLRQLLRIDDESEEGWALLTRIMELEKKRKSRTMAPGGFFYTRAGKCRKDMPWTLNPGSDAMKRSMARWPRRSLWRIRREVEPLFGEFHAIMEERGLIVPLTILTLSLTDSIRPSTQPPTRILQHLTRDPKLRIDLSIEDQERLFYSNQLGRWS